MGKFLARIFAIANQKGGVGKTTTSVNLSAALAATRKQVLLVDLDPQGNATMGSGIDKYQLERSTYDVLVHKQAVTDVLCRSEEGGNRHLGHHRDAVDQAAGGAGWGSGEEGSRELREVAERRERRVLSLVRATVESRGGSAASRQCATSTGRPQDGGER